MRNLPDTVFGSNEKFTWYSLWK